MNLNFRFYEEGRICCGTGSEANTRTMLSFGCCFSSECYFIVDSIEPA